MSGSPSARDSASSLLSPLARPLTPYRAAQAPYFVGRSRIFQETVRQLKRYARYDNALVLLEGESGTGKSFFARHLHDYSPRASKPFETVVLPTLDDNLAPSELFGHVRGAYTDARQHRPGRFVSASGGTLFLDEIGKASLRLQAKLLHAVEYREIWPVGSDRSVRVDVRLIAATNLSLDGLAASGDFVPDLVPRLSAFRIRLPALRERAEEIPDLVAHFISLRAPLYGYNNEPPAVDSGLIELLTQAEWPNNLRQLDATIQRLLVDAEGAPVLTAAHLGEMCLTVVPSDGSNARLTPERVQQVVDAAGSVTRAARALGVSRQTVHRYLSRGRVMGDPTILE
ncbi:MAG TPA: sigma 54-interacting transcriptional regulator [Steroidobacteraceae bacterium]|jgi:DNA-binding NtrC family response regulator